MGSPDVDTDLVITYNRSQQPNPFDKAPEHKLPNSTKSRTVRNTRRKPAATAETTTENAQATAPETDTNTEQENTEMATATETRDDELTFDFTVEAAPEDYEPQRANPGRTRKPSPFDEVLRDAYGKGWQRVAHNGDEEKRKAIHRELTRAKSFVNVGLDLNDTDTHVEFRSRELQKRTRKAKGNQLPEQSGDNGDSDE